MVTLNLGGGEGRSLIHLEGEIIMEHNQGIWDFSIRVRTYEEFLRTVNNTII